MRRIAAAALLALGGAVHAAEPGYPTKPIRLLVGSPPAAAPTLRRASSPPASGRRWARRS
jgi:hypothetical protein